MSALNWFLKTDTEATATNKNTNHDGTELSNIPSQSSQPSLKESIDSLRSENFIKFLDQLNILKSVSSLTTLSRLQAAMATSQISLEQIYSNINSIKTKLNDEINQFTYNINNEIGIQDSETLIEIKKINEKIDDLNKEILSIKEISTSFKIDKNNELANYMSISTELVNDINKLEDEVSINLGR